MDALHDYMTANMETLLEGRMLDDLTPSLIKQLTEFVRTQQAEKFSVTRSTEIFDRAMHGHGEWLTLQDIPQPIIPSNRPVLPRESPQLSPATPNRKQRRLSNAGSAIRSSPSIRLLATFQNPVPRQSEDEIFLMDDPDVNTPPVDAAVASEQLSSASDLNMSAKRGAVWTRRSSVPK